MDDIASWLTALSLGVLAFALVTATLTTLAARVRQERYRHDLILSARQRRSEYLDALAERNGEVG